MTVSVQARARLVHLLRGSVQRMRQTYSVPELIAAVTLEATNDECDDAVALLRVVDADAARALDALAGQAPPAPAPPPQESREALVTSGRRLAAALEALLTSTMGVDGIDEARSEAAYTLGATRYLAPSFGVRPVNLGPEKSGG